MRRAFGRRQSLQFLQVVSVSPRNAPALPASVAA
jgi:hypothetical protein